VKLAALVEIDLCDDGGGILRLKICMSKVHFAQGFLGNNAKDWKDGLNSNMRD